MQSKYAPLLALIFVFSVIRLLILFFGVDNLIYDLETNIGTISKLLSDGVSPSFIFDNFDNYRWGSMVCGILAVPFFNLFGERLIVLRAVAMLYCLGTLVLLYLFLYDFFSRRAAILAAIFFILAPPNYVKLSFTAMGGYCEINFFCILATFLFYKIFFAEGAARRHLYALLGFVCGVALFYDYTFLLTLSCCLLFWFVFDKGILVRKNFYIFALFFLIGFSLWFYYNATHHASGIFVMRERPLLSWFVKNGFFGSLIQLKHLVTVVIPGFFCFKDFSVLSGSVISYLYYFVLAVSFIGLFWLQRKSIARFFRGVVPLRRFSVSRGMISRETFPIVYVIIFGLAYAFCGISYLPPVEADLVLPHRFVLFIIPQLFMIIALFLNAMRTVAYGAFVSNILAGTLILIGIIGNAGMVPRQDYAISFLPEGYNYISFGKELRYVGGTDIERISDCVKKVNKRYRRFLYDGYRWATPAGYDGYRWKVPEEERMFSLKAYIHTAIQGAIDKDYWPFAYEHLGRAMGHSQRFGTSVDDEFKGQVAQAFHPYFYRGLGRSCVDKEFSEERYRTFLGIIDKQYQPYFREGMGIEMDVLFIQDTQAFTRFMSTLATEAKTDIYRGLARGREYPVISYRKFKLGFGQILPSTQEWRKRIDTIEEEFKPYCYQRLGIEIGWRFIYGIKGCQDFLQKADEQYKPQMYRGLGIGIGWRFGYNIRGCAALIQQAEQRYRAYLYEGLGTGVARRYGYRVDEQTQEREAAQVPGEFRDQFRKGLQEAEGV